MVWPALPAIPLIEETQTIRPFARSRSRSSSASLIRSSLERLISISRSQRSASMPAERLVAGDAGVVDDDVDAAVVGLERVADLRRRLGVGDVGDDRASRRSSR